MERSHISHWSNHNANPQNITNVHSALLGLPDIDDNTVTVHTGKKPHIEKNLLNGLVEHLHSLGAHLHTAAMVLPVNSKYNPSKPTTLIVGEV
eukprot:6490407-Amphidinium_carterae.4